MDSTRRLQRAKEIQDSIRDVLLHDWDPIGVAEVEEAQDEYDSYIGGVYRLLASGASEDDVVNYLWQVELEWGLGGDETKKRSALQLIARRLLDLNVKLEDRGEAPTE